MDMHGWDTVSIVSLDRINEGLRDNADKLLTSFDFKDSSLHIEGRFNAWQIRPGGSVGLIHLEVPIEQGHLNGLPGKNAQDIGNVSVLLEIALRLMPAADGSGRKELVFDFVDSDLDTARPLVSPVRTIDPDNKLDDVAKNLLANTVAACLTENGKQVSYVFASIGAADPSQTTWLTPSDSEWCFLQLQDEQCYLAILNVIEPRSTADLVKAVDPLIMKGGGSAFFAITPSLFLKNVLAPYMKASFRGGGGFKYEPNKQFVKNTSEIALPKMKHGIATIKPKITAMALRIVGGALVTNSHSRSQIETWIKNAEFTCDVTTTMPFAFDKKNKRITFKPDAKPKETHSLSLGKFWDFLIGWLVKIIVNANKSAITTAVTAIARNMQTMNTPPPAVLGWSGKRTFEVTDAKLDGCFWFADQRAE